MNTVKICGREFELYYNTYTMQKIAEKCDGDIANLGKWLSGGNTTEIVKKISDMTALLINGAIQKSNFAVECGFEKGEIRPLIDTALIAGNINPNDIGKFKDAIFAALASGSDYVMPEDVDVEIEQEDPDLKAIREANAKSKN